MSKPRRTPRTHITDTASAVGCGANGATHDAGLCERIRQLEAEVEQLKRNQHHCSCSYHFHWTPRPQWGNYTISNSSTASTIRPLGS